MDIWSLIFVCSAIYLIWFYRKKHKIKKLIKEEEKRIKAEQDAIVEKQKEQEKQEDSKKILLGINPKSSDNNIAPEKIVKKTNKDDGFDLIYQPPFDISASYRINTIQTFDSLPIYTLSILVKGMGTCTIDLGIGVITNKNRSHVLLVGDQILHFIPGEDAARNKIAQEEIDRKKRQQAAQEREKAEIARKVKERQRKRELEKIVTQELIDSGELFGEQPKRPPIPREVVDAVYRRDGGRCVYCGSTENLQLDHIIPFSKGGATTLENLQLLCQKCNLEKSNHIG